MLTGCACGTSSASNTDGGAFCSRVTTQTTKKFTNIVSLSDGGYTCEDAPPCSNSLAKCEEALAACSASDIGSLNAEVDCYDAAGCDLNASEKCPNESGSIESGSISGVCGASLYAETGCTF
jgi:hypothetical protein